MHHTASVPEVGCRQLRRIDWAGRPICIFLFAFRRYAPPAVGCRLLRGRRAQRGYPLRGLRCTPSSTLFNLVLLTHHSRWTLDLRTSFGHHLTVMRTEGSRVALGGGAAPPNTDRALGRTFSRVRVFIRCRLPHQQATCWGRLLLWATRWTLLRPTALRLVPVLL